MKKLIIPVKFQRGDKVYTFKQIKIEHICHICEGQGRIKYNDKDMRCPECMGVGRFTSNKQKYVVCEEEYKITTIKVTISGCKTQVKYKISSKSDLLNRAEENLYITKKEVQNKCDELNKERVLFNIDNIIIKDDFKATLPSLNKIQNKLTYYVENNKFEKDIVVDNNNILIDGYITYLLYKMLNKNCVKVIVENNANL